MYKVIMTEVVPFIIFSALILGLPAITYFILAKKTRLTKITKIFISGCFFIFLASMSFFTWRLLAIAQKVDKQVATETPVINDIKNKQVRPLQSPVKDLYQKGELAIGNNIELTVKGFTRHKFQNKVLQAEKFYCAVNIDIKNVVEKELKFDPDITFFLQGETGLEFALVDITGFGGEVTEKPENSSYIGENEITLKLNEVKSGFVPFECDDENKKDFTFIAEINKYTDEVILADGNYKQIKVKLAL
jgi:hypothetical protein